MLGFALGVKDRFRSSPRPLQWGSKDQPEEAAGLLEVIPKLTSLQDTMVGELGVANPGTGTCQYWIYGKMRINKDLLYTCNVIHRLSMPDEEDQHPAPETAW